MNRAELKAMAKEQIKGKIGILFLIILIIGVLTFAADLVLSFMPLGSIISLVIITPAFSLSTINVYIALTKGATPKAGDAFSGFDNFWGAFKVTFLVGLFTFLWSLLFIIPGIIKAYSYSMSMYILSENPDKPALECIAESKKMTDGHKMELFVLNLSFIGWILLVSITFGIAGIWVIPYVNATMANTYNWLKGIPVVEGAPVTEPVEPATEG